MIVFPNCKINIGLNITEKRGDGFHNLESIFYPLPFSDVLEIIPDKINKQGNVIFTVSGIPIPGKSEDNLCLKVYRLLEQKHKLPAVRMHLHKIIPTGAGLGGGSADSAFMLKALNELFELNFSTQQLVHYAQQLGSDCAFFIANQPVFAFHKGDEFESLDLDLSLYKIEVSYPNIHIGTAEAYAGITPTPSEINLKEVIQQPIENWKNSVKNDFENSIFPNHPEIKNAKEKMYQNGALYASMTGSGSAVFGIFRN